MRLMLLIDLSSNDSAEIPYSLIKETLGIMKDGAEYWVVNAIASKILDCRMDQMNQIVIVSWHIEQSFWSVAWQALQSKLAVWRANVANVISTIQANKPDEVHAIRSVATRR